MSKHTIKIQPIIKVLEDAFCRKCEEHFIMEDGSVDCEIESEYCQVRIAILNLAEGGDLEDDTPK